MSVTHAVSNSDSASMLQGPITPVCGPFLFVDASGLLRLELWSKLTRNLYRVVLREFVLIVGTSEEATLPQYADEESKQQDACQDGYQNDPPGDRVLLCKIKLWVDHYWELYRCIPENQMFDAGLYSDVGSNQQLQSTHCWEILYKTASPQPGMDLEDSLTGEAVERTLEQHTSR